MLWSFGGGVDQQHVTKSFIDLSTRSKIRGTWCYFDRYNCCLVSSVLCGDEKVSIIWWKNGDFFFFYNKHDFTLIFTVFILTKVVFQVTSSKQSDFFFFFRSFFSHHSVHSVRHYWDQSEVMERVFAWVNVYLNVVFARVPRAGWL